MRRLASLAAIVWIIGAYQAQAQAPQASTMQSPGARAGNSVVPSTHSPGCGGVLCDSDDPRRVAAVPPPPCEGLLCSLSPYAMAPPVTGRVQEEQARAQAAAAAAGPPPAPEKVQKRRRAKAKTSRTVAARTPDPSAAQPAAAASR